MVKFFFFIFIVDALDIHNICPVSQKAKLLDGEITLHLDILAFKISAKFNAELPRFFCFVFVFLYAGDNINRAALPFSHCILLDLYLSPKHHVRSSMQVC